MQLLGFLTGLESRALAALFEEEGGVKPVIFACNSPPPFSTT